MTDEDKQKYIAYLTLRSELENAKRRGAELYLDGRKREAEYIASACVFNDNADYMCDYVTDSSGALGELKFNRVQNR